MRRAAAMPIAGAVAIALLAQNGAAQTPRIDDARRALAGAEHQAIVTAAKASRLDAQAAGARADANRAHRAGAAIAIELAAARARVAAARARLAAIDRARALQAERLAVERAPLAGLLATVERMALRPPALALAQPSSIADMTRTRTALAALTPAIAARTAAVRAALDETKRLHAEGERAGARLVEAERALAERSAAFDRAERAARTRADSASSGADDVRKQLAALTEELATRRALVATLGRDQERSAQLAALAPPPLRPGIAGRAAAYRLPVRGRVRMGMGDVAPNGGRTRGLTIETAPGATVVAPAAGRVAYAGPFRGYGEIVIIDHGRGWTSLLAGLGQAETGTSWVGQGVPVGRMGSPPLLTIELRHHAQPVDVAAIAAWRGR